MALNVKVAMLTCLFFIGGMSWVVHQVATPVIAAPAPVVVERVPGDMRTMLTKPTPAIDHATPVIDKTEVAEQFAHAGVTAPSEMHPMVQQQTAVPMARVEPPRRELPPIAAREFLAGDSAPRVAFVSDEDFEPAESGDSNASDADLLWDATSSGVPMAILASDAQIIDEPQVAFDTTDSDESDGDALEESDGLATMLAAKPPSGKRYVVRRGDSLVRILRREWRRSDSESINAFLAVNPRIRDRKDYTIRIGEKLVIPSRDTALAYMALVLSDAGHKEATRNALPSRARKRRVYKVRLHDTLVKIAREKLHDSERWTEIAKLNGLKNADVILPGTEILLPEKKGTDT